MSEEDKQKHRKCMKEYKKSQSNNVLKKIKKNIEFKVLR